MARQDTKLAKYRQMRDFSRTAEPSGDKPVAASERLRFVIQKHDATRLHYDLRLELDGVFKSWAVPKGLSLDPADKRMAVETEDHPLDYGDFEGTIPKDEYGGGTVQLWDRGYWMPEGDPHRALKRGNLRFAVLGDRLQGTWHLVRRKLEGSKRPNWLLFKSRDEYVQPGVDPGADAKSRSVASGRSLDEIEAGKGRAPTPFMTAKRFKAGAVWHSNRAEKTDGAARRASSVKEHAAVATGRSAGSVKARKASAGKEKRARGKRAALREPASRSARNGVDRNVARAKGSRRAVRMPDFVDPQLCQLVDRAPSGAGWIHEVKFDGYRLQLRNEGGEARLRTRSGLDWTEKFAAIARAAEGLPDCVIDGEACAIDQDGLPDFPALQAALSEGRSEDLLFFAFDLLFTEGEDLRRLPVVDRKARLQALLATPRRKVAQLRYVEHFVAAGDAVMQSACQMRLEGIVSKRSDAAYVSGRPGTWTKAKCRGGHEVLVVGWTSEGERFRSLVAAVHRGEQLVYVGNVGTGFGAAIVARLVPRLKALKTNANPFPPGKGPPRRGGVQYHWTEPQLVAEIEYAGWTGDGHLRQASFKGLREDKSPAEVQAEEAVQPEQAVLADVDSGAKARKTASRRKASLRTERGDTTRAARGKTRGRGAETGNIPVVVTPTKLATAPTSGTALVMGVAISHPDKPLWPDEDPAVTKLDLARYYEELGDWVIEHLKGRPCSVVRTPDGIKAETFFQRHAMAGQSHLVTLTQVSGDKKPYIQLDRPEALIAMAQVAATELHPWNCQPGNPELPGRFVFDLDPAPDLAFEAVVKAAHELRERLEELGFATFCKTTGGKGLHVVVPLTDDPKSPDWDVAKMFCREICRRMADDAPTRYVLNMAKKERTGRIFLDYLRNDRTATAVAPLSTRARPGASVSMPLAWNVVRKGLDPARFTLRTAPALLRKSKPWQDYAQAAVPLRSAIEKLVNT